MQEYEVERVVPIEETVEAADPALEDEEDFIDVPGVLAPEQGAKAIEDIIQAVQNEEE